MGSKRIAYVDIDAHHGDGVFYAFEDDPDVIFADMHEDGRYLYPGTGAARRNRQGRGGAAPSSTCRVPPGADDDAFARVWPQVIEHLERARAGVHHAPVRRGQPRRRPDHPPALHRRPPMAARRCELCAARPTGSATAACSALGGGGYNRANLAQALERACVESLLWPPRSLLAGQQSPAGGVHIRYNPRPLIPPKASPHVPQRPWISPSFDPELPTALEGERRRQEEHIELIASENYTSPRVLEAQGSVLTNKYAEGYPGKRYYGGCEYVDIAEQLAIDRAKKLFGADYANVQPHSGSQANAAVYLALVKPGDTMLGMSLDHGGHLTHGAKVNFSGKLFKAVQYGIRPDNGEIDYDDVRQLAEEHRPQHDRRRLLGLFARHRLGEVRGDREERRRVFRSSTWRTSPASSPTGLYPEPDSARGRRDHHHAQDAARPARRADPRARER